MVARAVLLSDSIDSASIPLILTLATPHTAPPLALDSHIQSFYDKVTIANDYYYLLSIGSDFLSILCISALEVINELNIEFNIGPSCATLWTTQ